jgi:hypothetical protein
MTESKHESQCHWSFHEAISLLSTPLIDFTGQGKSVPFVFQHAKRNAISADLA